jgi:hypothetical protein
LQSLYAQRLTQIKNDFACSKHSNLKSGGQFLFFIDIIFSTKCASFLLKIEEDSNIDDLKGKRI